MSRDKCKVCGNWQHPEPLAPWENLQWGYCPQCGCCLGRYLYDPVELKWNKVPPHRDAGKFVYYMTTLWGGYYCPRCNWGGNENGKDGEEKIDNKQDKILDQLTEEAQRLGMGY